MMYTETKIARNGETLHKRYALYDFGIDQIETEIEWAQPVMVTDDPLEITAQVGGCECDDKKWCVEIFGQMKKVSFAKDLIMTVSAISTSSII